MQWYSTALNFIKKTFPKLRKTRQTNLALLTYGILKGRSLCPSVIVRAWPLPTNHHHRKKRLQRFLDNNATNPLALSQELIPQLCYTFGLAGKEIPIALDWTPEEGKAQSFFATIPYKGRALPLLCWHLKGEDITTSQNHLEEALVRRVAQALPETATPVFLADRAFGRGSFLKFLEELRRYTGRKVEYVVRLKGDVKIEWQGEKRALKDLPMERGKVYWLPGVRYRDDGVVRINLVLFWDWQMKEPWYLATSFLNPRKAIKWYGKRMKEEEMFGDDKHLLGMRGMKKVKSSARKEKLLLGLMLVYVLLAVVAEKSVPEEFAKQVVSWGKGSFVFLALEWLEENQGPSPELAQFLGVG